MDDPGGDSGLEEEELQRGAGGEAGHDGLWVQGEHVGRVFRPEYNDKSSKDINRKRRERGTAGVNGSRPKPSPRAVVFHGGYDFSDNFKRDAFRRLKRCTPGVALQGHWHTAGNEDPRTWVTKHL